MLGYVFSFCGAATSQVHSTFAPVTPASITPRVRRLPGGGRKLCALDSRHGRVLFLKNTYHWENKQSMLVWNAVTGEQQKVRLPEEFRGHCWSACILCNAQGCDHLDCGAGGGPYNIVFVGATYAAAYLYGFVYSSVTGAWTATAVLHTPESHSPRAVISSHKPSTMVGDSVYFWTARASIIRYQLDGSRLSFIKLPGYDQFEDTLVLVPAAGRLQFAALRASKEWKVRLRELVIDSDGAPKWIRRKKFVLPMPCVRMAGFVEEPPSLILDTKDKETICINMEDCKWHKLPKANGEFDLLPIMSFYPPLSPGTAREADEASPSSEEEVSRIRIFSRSVIGPTAHK